MTDAGEFYLEDSGMIWTQQEIQELANEGDRLLDWPRMF
jgi:hypothetical protein